MKKTKQNNRVTIELSDDDIRWLKKEAKKNDTSMSWVIRRSIRSVINDEQ